MTSLSTFIFICLYNYNIEKLTIGNSTQFNKEIILVIIVAIITLEQWYKVIFILCIMHPYAYHYDLLISAHF